MQRIMFFTKIRVSPTRTPTHFSSLKKIALLGYFSNNLFIVDYMLYSLITS
jgi:hypothetical protein